LTGKPMGSTESEDMLDPRTEVDQSGELRELLTACEPVVADFYDAERKALGFQVKYRSNVRRAFWSGTIAVVLAVALMLSIQVNLGSLFSDRVDKDALLVVTSIEFGAALIALKVVLGGQYRLDKENWLVERNSAERCRLLKFRVLIHPGIWTGKQSVKSYDTVKGPLAVIQARDIKGLWDWIQKDPPPRWEPIDRHVPWPTLQPLVAYYQGKRLEFQMRYLSQTAKRYEEKHWAKRYEFPFYFYASLVVVIAHVIAEGLAYSPLLSPYGPAVMKVLSLILLALAIVLPAIGTASRTKHLADEPARNASRYKAKWHALQQLQGSLSRAVEARDAEAVLRTMSFCEQVLELDQREWLRLMIEAEWF
jgi:hypothetical protein